MNIKFILADCTIYNYSTKATEKKTKLFSNERALKNAVKEDGGMLLEYEKKVENIEVSEYFALRLYESLTRGDEEFDENQEV